MIALTIADVKKFMQQLLISNTFDNFLIQEASVTTYAHFHIDGLLHKDFFDSDKKESLQEREYLYWKEIKEYIYNFIKGKRTPLNFKFTFCLSPQQTSDFFKAEAFSLDISFIRNLIFNLYFDGKNLTCTTATSYKQFVLDKSIDISWDIYTKKFFQEMQIAFIQVS